MSDEMPAGPGATSQKPSADTNAPAGRPAADTAATKDSRPADGFNPFGPSASAGRDDDFNSFEPRPRQTGPADDDGFNPFGLGSAKTGTPGGQSDEGFHALGSDPSKAEASGFDPYAPNPARAASDNLSIGQLAEDAAGLSESAGAKLPTATEPQPGDPQPADPEPSDPTPGDPEPEEPEPGRPTPPMPVPPNRPDPNRPDPNRPDPSRPEPPGPFPAPRPGPFPNPGQPPVPGPTPSPSPLPSPVPPGPGPSPVPPGPGPSPTPPGPLPVPPGPGPSPIPAPPQPGPVPGPPPVFPPPMMSSGLPSYTVPSADANLPAARQFGPGLGAPSPPGAPFGGDRPGSSPYGNSEPATAPFADSGPGSSPYGNGEPATAPFRDNRPGNSPYGGQAGTAPYGNGEPATTPFGGGAAAPSPYGVGGPASTPSPFGGFSAPGAQRPATTEASAAPSDQQTGRRYDQLPQQRGDHAGYGNDGYPSPDATMAVPTGFPSSDMTMPVYNYGSIDSTMPVSTNPVENSGSLTGHILSQGWRDEVVDRRRNNLKVAIAMLVVLGLLVAVSLVFLLTAGDAFTNMIRGVFK